MNKNLKPVLFFLTISLFLITCKQKAKEGDCVHEKAHLYLTVIDNQSIKIDNAVINIFDTYENFEKARVEKNNSAYAIATFSSLSTTEVEIPVDPYTEHWVLVTKYDSVQLKYLSSELTVSKLDRLQSCSDYHSSVNVVPTGATVAFWTPSSINLPIKIKFNNILDSLTSLSSVEPLDAATPGYPKPLNFPVTAGTYQYQATSNGNCIWQGEVTVVDGEFKTIQLEPCQRTVVAIYADASSGIPNVAANEKFPINVFMDNNTTPVGVITGIYSGPTLTSSCPGLPLPPNVLYIYLEPGVTHTFKAVSSAGSSTSCIWTGNTLVLNTDCSLNAPVKLWTGCN